MIEIIQAILIGAVQGVSEFFPISSSGHLVLIPYIFGWNYQGLSFDVALHLGTVIAIIAYFWKDWKTIIGNAINKSETRSYPCNLLWQIIVASIPVGIAGYFLNDYVETKLHSPLLIAFNLIFFGVVLWLVDKFANKSNKLSVVSYKQSLLVGVFQAISLFPGVSRSGITITAGRLAGLNRENAASLAFLLATPAMVGAFLFKFKDIAANDLNAVFISGTISAAFFGFFAIRYLLKYLKRGSFSVFVWYRILLAIVVLVIYFAK